MLCVINESELEYTLERGLPLAEAHEWVARPAAGSSDHVALSAEQRREMAPAPSDAQQVLTLTAAEASRIMNVAISAGEPGPVVKGAADGLDLAGLSCRGPRTLRVCRVPRIPYLRLRLKVSQKAGWELRSLRKYNVEKP